MIVIQLAYKQHSVDVSKTSFKQTSELEASACEFLKLKLFPLLYKERIELTESFLGR